MKNIEYKNILIVEDSNDLRNNLVSHFSIANKVTSCFTLSEAIFLTKSNDFDIILLDLVLPDGNGLKLFEYAKQTPIIILSDLGSDENLIDGYTAGALDYIVKPASNELIELRMSLRLLPSTDAILSSHGLSIDIKKRIAKYKNKILNLTSSEFNILLFLMQNAGNFYTAIEIYEQVWKMPHLNTTTIKAHLSNLRKKMISISEECASLIVTEFGKGYCFIKKGGKK